MKPRPNAAPEAQVSGEYQKIWACHKYVVIALRYWISWSTLFFGVLRFTQGVEGTRQP